MIDLQLIARLRAAGVAVEPHRDYADEWYAGTVAGGGLGGGDVGPYTSAEEALVGGVAWLVRLLYETQVERDGLATEARNLRTALDAVRTELRKEREARGQ